MAFVKQSFHTDVADPENYDLVINTAKSDNDAAVGAIIGAISGGKKLIEKNSEKCYFLRPAQATYRVLLQDLIDHFV